MWSTRIKLYEEDQQRRGPYHPAINDSKITIGRRRFGRPQIKLYEKNPQRNRTGFLPLIEMCSVGLIVGVVDQGSKAMTKMNNEIGMVFQQIMEMR